MLTLHTWTTPNGYKPAILLEELGLQYRTRFVNLGKDEQFRPEFLAISPNNKIPALVDDDAPGGPLSIFESGAILTYLAEREGRFLASSGPARFKTLEWLHWQIGGLGPMLGQLNFFARRAPEPAPMAIERFTDEAKRLLGVMERRLQAEAFLGGADYSIADIACYPWMVTAQKGLSDILGEEMGGTGIGRWLSEIAARPAVQRGMAIAPPPTA